MARLERVFQLGDLLKKNYIFLTDSNKREKLFLKFSFKFMQLSHSLVCINKFFYSF